MEYPEHLTALIDALRKFPSVGFKSAERFAFAMLSWTEEERSDFAKTVDLVGKNLQCCTNCGCLKDLHKSCQFCERQLRTEKRLCIIAHPKDAFAFEETGQYQGFYHVLTSVLNPLEGKAPSKAEIDQIRERINDLEIQEIVIALDSTLESDATALFLKRELADLELPLSRIAFGLPMGSRLDYVDEGTLGRALAGRQGF